ncbi:hypothetical protein [Streptomyces sp. NRRL S-920]|uniref:hypothetical protein n=1 Tax=Streptomyces sp. NRRL S-920 TaxID=1463921 RepID=UPI00131D7FA0|nr:hypothetical protein [Streptomyces sp. NRRL S-920]
MKLHATAVAAVAVALAALTACGGGDDSKPKPSKSTEAAQKPAEGSGVPTPSAAQRAALIRALGAVEPGLVENEERAVSRSRSVCLDLKEKKPAATVRANAEARFEGGTVPTLSADQAAQIVIAIRSNLCG